MSDVTRVGGVQAVEGVAGGTTIPVTATQGTAAAATAPWYVRLSNGAAAFAESAALALFAKITDGTNTAAVKAASTAAQANDPSLVVAVSPNSPAKICDNTGANIATVKAASTAPVAGDTALVVGVSPNGAVPVAQYHATTPGKADLAIGPLEQNLRGMVYIYDSLRHARKIPLNSAAAATPVSIATGANTGWPLAEGPCDELEVGSDGVIVFRQPPEKPWMLVDGGLADATKWTVGGGWTFDAGAHTLTHANGGGANTTTQDTATTNPNDPILSGETYLVGLKVTGRTGGSFTVALGTGASGAIAADGVWIVALTSAGGTASQLIITPTNDFDGVIQPISATLPICVLPATLARNTGRLYRDACYILGGVATTAAPTVLITTATVLAHWRRKAGATNLG